MARKAERGPSGQNRSVPSNDVSMTNSRSFSPSTYLQSVLHLKIQRIQNHYSHTM